MSLNPIEKEIERQANFQQHAIRDPEKNFYAKSLKTDEPPTPIMQGLIPKTDLAVEKLSSTDLHNPGEFCYRKMAMASGTGTNAKTIFTKKVMMCCPFCNKPQFLYNNDKVYDGPTDPRKWWQKALNKLFRREIWGWTEQLTGTLTVKGPITCIFNNLHRWTVIKNKISFYYPKTIVK